MMVVAGGVLAMVAPSHIASAAQERPNILWIYIEDQDPRYSCYGEELVRTPNIDALAREGVLFERAYVPAPVCAPSRSAIITGSYAIRLGVHNMRSSRDPSAPIYLPEGVKTVPELFRKAGYFTFNRGKDDYNFMYDRTKLYSTGGKSEGIKGSKPSASRGGKQAPKSGGGDWNDRPKDTPFFAQIQTLGGKHAHGDMQAKLARIGATPVDPEAVTVPPQYPDIPEIRDKIADHLNTMLLSDHEVGEIVNRLKADGLWENTVIFLFSDHGSYMPRSKEFCYDEGLHVPLIIAAPGMKETVKPGTVQKHPTAVLDITATSLALAGLEIPEYMDSRDLFAKDYSWDYVYAARDRCEWAIDRIRSVTGERYHYIRNFMTDRPLWQPNYRSGWPWVMKIEQMYRNGELTPVQAAPYRKRPAEELYDLQSDPHEVQNLMDDPKHKDALIEMRGLLEAWIEETGDKGQFPESKAGLRAVKMRFPKQAIGPEFRDL